MGRCSIDFIMPYMVNTSISKRLMGAQKKNGLAKESYLALALNVQAGVVLVYVCLRFYVKRYN